MEETPTQEIKSDQKPEKQNKTAPQPKPFDEEIEDLRLKMQLNQKV